MSLPLFRNIFSHFLPQLPRVNQLELLTHKMTNSLIFKLKADGLVWETLCTCEGLIFILFINFASLNTDILIITSDITSHHNSSCAAQSKTSSSSWRGRSRASLGTAWTDKNFRRKERFITELDSYSAEADSNFSEVNQISVALLISTELSLGGSNGAQNFYSTIFLKHRLFPPTITNLWQFFPFQLQLCQMLIMGNMN